MTVERTNVFSGPMSGNGFTKVFPFTFHAASADEVAVELNGNTVDQAQYTVSVNPDGTGEVTFFVAPVGTIFVFSDPLFTQEVDFENQGPFYQRSVNEPIDRSALRDLILKDGLDRSLKVARGETPLALPPRAARGGKFLGFGADPDVLLALFGGGGDAFLRTDLAASAAGAKLVSYLLASAGAKPAALDEKLGQTIELFDNLTPAQKSAVRSGSAPDVTEPLQAIINYANGGESTGNATGGTRLYIKGGRYIVSQTLKNNFRFDNDIIDDGDLRRLCIEGDGTANTSLFYTGPAGTPLFEMKGNNRIDGRESHQVIKGLRFRRNFGVRGTAIGIRLTYLANVYFDDVQVDGFDLGIQATDVLGFYAYALLVLGNNVGLRAQVNAWTRPNVLHFWAGAFSGNGDIGLDVKEGANVGLYGTRLEGNGTGGAGDTSVLVQQAPAEGGGWFEANNCYVEGTNAESDFSFTTSTSNSGAANIRMCSFNRASPAAWANHHIDCYAGGAGEIRLHVDSCGFRSFNGYVPSLSRSAVRNQTPAKVLITSTNNLFMHPEERIEANGSPVFGYNYLQLGAAGVISGTATPAVIGGDNIASISRASAGRVRVNFVRPFLTNNPAPSATPIGAGPGANIVVSDYYSTYVEFQCSIGTTPTDMAFSFEVKGPIA